MKYCICASVVCALCLIRFLACLSNDVMLLNRDVEDLDFGGFALSLRGGLVGDTAAAPPIGEVSGDVSMTRKSTPIKQSGIESSCFDVDEMCNAM